jgi:VanZ family protein
VLGAQAKTMQISDLERRLVIIIWTFTFVVALAAFSIGLLTHANTFAVADALIRWLAPHASAEDVSELHILGRELGHFFIPAGAYLALVLGPLRNRRYVALGLCAMFAVLDETLQTFTPGRTGSIYDIAIAVAGALCGFLLHSVIAGGGRRAVRSLIRPK